MVIIITTWSKVNYSKLLRAIKLNFGICIHLLRLKNRGLNPYFTETVVWGSLFYPRNEKHNKRAARMDSTWKIYIFGM